MSNLVACNECGRILDVDPNESRDRRMPCPDCGSTKRAHSFSASMKLSVGGSAVLSGGVDVPNLLMQTVVEKGDTTDEGQIIVTVTSVWYEIIKLIEKDPQIMYQIDPRKLEEIIAGLHERTGMFDKVTLTPRSGDHGRDVIVEKYGHYSLRFIDQVKAYKPGHVVTADEIRATIGTLAGDNSLKAIVTTTSEFAPRIMEDPAVRRLHPFRLELRDGEILRQMLLEMSKKQ